MFDQLSDDVVRRIFHYLSVRERARFSSVNKRLIALFSTWDDVFYCSARLGGVSLAGEDFVVEIEKPLRPDSTVKTHNRYLSFRIFRIAAQTIGLKSV
ncbi:unnamed protein product [Toxocara canis]|uniref:F-box domain-containing protein n=1 Tax=Toxocara canis TaxID=6265 RepID=A0A183V9D2_TOXCA|nr:unnamed protein product [Toxocara canis]